MHLPPYSLQTPAGLVDLNVVECVCVLIHILLCHLTGELPAGSPHWHRRTQEERGQRGQEARLQCLCTVISRAGNVSLTVISSGQIT